MHQGNSFLKIYFPWKSCYLIFKAWNKNYETLKRKTRNLTSEPCALGHNFQS